MNSKVKTGLLIALLTANIGVMGFAGGSAVWMLKNGQKAEAAPESSIVIPETSKPDESSKPQSVIGPDGREEHAVAEDDVTIGGTYHIRSTLKISDAYKSGDTSGLNKTEQETLQMASDLLKSIIKDGMSDYDKEKAVYEWMVTNLKHDSGMLLVISTADASSDSPYGVLKNKKGVCVGFATTFRLLMQMQNIECKVVHDSGLGHSWDIVKLGDHWYHTDIYSDLGSPSYQNFNMSDAMCMNGHSWDQDFFPKADSLEYNPAFRSRVKISDIYALPGAVRKTMEKRKLIQCYVIDQPSLNETEQDNLNNILTALKNLGGEIYDNGSISLPSECMIGEEEGTGKPMAVISFYDPNSSDNEYVRMSEEDRKKANDALRRAFRGLGYIEIPEVEEFNSGDDEDDDFSDSTDSESGEG